MRALVLVLDSVGVGGASDAADYGDDGANTLGNLYGSVPDFTLPGLEELGLTAILDRNTDVTNRASYGWMQERSKGKDTTTGHWELAGVITEHPFATYERFPDDLVMALERATGYCFLAWVIHEDRSETKQTASVARRAPLFRLKAYRHTSMSKNGVQRSKWSLLQVAVDRS